MKKAVVITGASSGIGAATAVEFSHHNYFVFLLGRDPDRLTKTSQLCGANNSQVLTCDFKNLATITACSESILARSDVQLHCLVNNAGVFYSKSFDQTSNEIWIEQFQVNLLGHVHLTKLLYPHFARQMRGSIVNVSSTLGVKPSANTSAYSAIKAAMNSWTQTLALEGGSFGIRANAVCPGIVDTPIHSFFNLPEMDKTKTLESLGKLQPLGRIGQPEEIAKSIFFLGSDLSSWTTGAMLNVDGGINLA